MQQDIRGIDLMVYMQHNAGMKQAAQKAPPAFVREMYDECILTRARLISRVITNMYDAELRPFGINAPQLALLTMIGRRGPICRSDIGRLLLQDRSTLTRTMKLVDAEGWIDEVDNPDGGRGRPVVLSEKGKAIMRRTESAWRLAQAKAVKLIGSAGAKVMCDIGDELLDST
jgi:DNA-binding MarR family transcriptional regulator